MRNCKLRAYTLGAAVLLAMWAGSLQASSPDCHAIVRGSDGTGHYELIVRPSPPTPVWTVEIEPQRRITLRKIAELPAVGAAVVRVPVSAGELVDLQEKLQAQLSKSAPRGLAPNARPALVAPNVRIRELQGTMSLAAAITPNDTSINAQWGLRDVEAVSAWEVATGSSQVVVAVLDSGVDYKHPDLKKNMWKGPNGEIGVDFTKATPGTDPMDKSGHGTKVAGIISAVTNNGQGIAGTTWSTRIMPVRILSDEPFSQARAVQGIDYAVRKGAKIINASWGVPCKMPYVLEAIRKAGQQGVLFVTAAGKGGLDNDNPDAATYPAAYGDEQTYGTNNVIAVMAHTFGPMRYSNSNFGKRSVFISAPGDAICSTLPQARYDYISASSAAAPWVSAAAALLKARDPDLTPPQIKRIIHDTAIHVPAFESLTVAKGRLSIGRALGVVAPDATVQETMFVPGVCAK
jgi:thermitase